MYRLHRNVAVCVLVLMILALGRVASAAPELRGLESRHY